MPPMFAKGRGLPGQYRIGDKRYDAGTPVPEDAPVEDVEALAAAGYIVEDNAEPEAPETPPVASEATDTEDEGLGDDEDEIEALRALGEEKGVSLARMTNTENMRAKLEDAGVDVDAELADDE